MGTFRQATGITIREAFLSYHAENPKVYDEVKALAFEAIRAGKKKLSFKLIINVVRWNVYISTSDEHCAFKINDAYSAHYARMFAEEFPQYLSMIELRALRS